MLAVATAQPEDLTFTTTKGQIVGVLSCFSYEASITCNKKLKHLSHV